MPSSTSIPIIVQGNSFSLAIPLQIYVISEGAMVLQDYTPDPTDQVSIQLKGSRRQYTYAPTIQGNTAFIDLSGNELADNYGVVVSIVKADGTRLRSFRTDQFFIVESSDDLTQDDIIAGLEENVIYLNAQAFIAGADGRGIEGIQKTGTSGLVDTYTIYYTDNTTSTFQVTNGANGQAGAQGVGITSIEKTGTSGLVDTYTITLSNGQTSTFEVTNGQDGHDLGLAVIVDDLTTGGHEDALSAEQGKILGDEIYGGFAVVTPTSVKGWVESNLSASHLTDNKRTCVRIPVKAGDVVRVTAINGNSTSVFLSNANPVNGYWECLKEDNTPATSRFSVSSGNTGTFTAPADAKYFMANATATDASADFTPLIEIKDTSNSLKGRVENLEQETEHVEDELFGDDGIVTPTTLGGWIESNLQATHTNDRTCVRVPVSEGDVVTVTASSNGASTGVFLSAENPVNGYWQCVNEDGTPATSRFSVPAGSTLSFVAPSNALFYLANGNATDAGTDFTPIIAINRELSLKERIEALEGAAEKNVKEFGAKGDGTTNDTSAIQRAFNAGGDIYFPAGTYIINDYIDVYSHTHVRMDSQAVIKRSATSTQKCLLRTMFSATTTEYNGIEDFTIEGGVLDMNSSNTNVGACLAMLHAKDMRFEGVTFEHARNEYHLVDMGASCNVKFINCVFRNSLTNNVNAEQIQIDFAERVGHPYRQFDAGSACYDLTPCKNIEICGCAFYLNGYSPAVGNHNYGLHTDIDIHDNVVYGAGASVTTATRGAFAFAQAYSGGGVNKTEALIHHNFVNDCRFIVTTKNDALCHIYLRDNIFKNFYSVKNSSSDAGIELLNNIELNES